MPQRIRIQRYTLGPFAENCYLLIGPSGRRAALVDPGIGSESLIETLRELELELEWIINTHGHVDHVAGNAFFKEQTGAPLILHAADVPLLEQAQQQGIMFGVHVRPSPPPDEHFEEGRPLPFDGVTLDVLHTPGHSPGGVCIRLDDRVLVGDTLFQGSIGRTDLPGGSLDELIHSIRQKLFRLPARSVCYPGHGPETTIAEERRSNPFVADRLADAVS